MGATAVQQSIWSYVLNEPTRILVADDDPILCEFASVHLSSPTAVIETAADGVAALSLLAEGQFDVALVDIAMPELDGFALLEKIRAEPKLRHLPVIMLTGLEDIASIDRAFSLGANSFVTKPVNWRLLNYHVRYVLRSSRVERQLRKARHHAETKEAAYNRTLLAFEVECRGVLKSILQHAESARAGGLPPELVACMQRIEELAVAALGRWDDASVGTGDSNIAAPLTSAPAIKEPDRCSCG
jgi:two-component system, sensor histidine kinase and response regulator